VGREMGRLTTHVLDVAAGRPAGGLRIELFRLDPARRRVALATTNADGRCDGPLLEGAAMEAGTWELVFHAGDYFRARGVALPEPAFLDQIPIRLGIASAKEHYHVPLLVAPYGYSTYRGS
jgi:5-hydroxyisourate hydrolase